MFDQEVTVTLDAIGLKALNNVSATMAQGPTYTLQLSVYDHAIVLQQSDSRRPIALAMPLAANGTFACRESRPGTQLIIRTLMLMPSISQPEQIRHQPRTYLAPVLQ